MLFSPHDELAIAQYQCVSGEISAFPETESDKPSARPSARSAHHPTSPESPILARRPTADRSGSSRAATTLASQIEVFKRFCSSV